MCMTVAVALHGTTILATDLRHGGKYADGRVERRDYGGKIARSPAGIWVTGTGDLPLMEAVCAAVHRLRAPTPELIARTIRKTSAACADAIRAQYPGASGAVCIHVAAPNWIGSFAADGSVTGAGVGTNRFTATWPPEVNDDAQRSAQLGAELQQTTDADAALRCVAAAFANVARVAPSVSPDIEVAVGGAFLRGPARDLSRAADFRSYISTAPIGPIDLLTLWKAAV